MRGRFNCVHVRRFLDPEDLVPNVKRRRGRIYDGGIPEREIRSGRNACLEKRGG
jgi:hypothetical protein